jgi:hypothetical protein
MWTKRKGEQMHLITTGASTYSSDSRYSIEHVQPNDWQLHVKYVNERDEGHFECSISSVPPLVFVVFLEIIGKLACALEGITISLCRGAKKEEFTAP